MKTMRLLAMTLCMMGLSAGFVSCSDEDEVHQSIYTSKFELVEMSGTSSSVGNLKPDMTYQNQVVEGANAIAAKHKVEKSVTYTGSDYATFDAEALALLEPAIAEMQAWQEEMHALKYEKDHKGSSFTCKYRYVVRRDSVTLKESDLITFSYSRGSLKNLSDKFFDNIYYFACKEGIVYNPNSSVENKLAFDLTKGLEAVGLTELDSDDLEIIFYNPSNTPVELGVGSSVGMMKWSDGVARPTLEIELGADYIEEGAFGYGQWYVWMKGMHDGLPFAFMVPFEVVEAESDFL